MSEGSGRFLRWHIQISRSARSFRGGPTGDLVSIGWISALARGGTEHVRTAQAGLIAALRAQQ